MRVSDVLRSKGSRVETIPAEATVLICLHRLRTLGIGALVVSSDGEHVEGIVSERDVVRALAEHGSDLLDMRVRDLMTRSVATCRPDDGIRHVMAEMTRRRVRHLPVVSDGTLCGIVSIGDVVKSRLDELELETQVLRDAYIVHR